MLAMPWPELWCVGQAAELSFAIGETTWAWGKPSALCLLLQRGSILVPSVPCGQQDPRNPSLGAPQLPRAWGSLGSRCPWQEQARWIEFRFIFETPFPIAMGQGGFSPHGW